jgi:hypothetical protein
VSRRDHPAVWRVRQSKDGTEFPLDRGRFAPPLDESKRRWPQWPAPRGAGPTWPRAPRLLGGGGPICPPASARWPGGRESARGAASDRGPPPEPPLSRSAGPGPSRDTSGKSSPGRGPPPGSRTTGGAALHPAPGGSFPSKCRRQTGAIRSGLRTARRPARTRPPPS